MKIVFIGAGNVATHLAKELYKYKHEIVQVYSRTMDSAQALASQVTSATTDDLSQIRQDADIYMFSVKDSVLPDVLSQVPPNNGLWIHTAGSMSMDIFEKHILRYGVIYPFQTFSKNCIIDWKAIPLFVEASSASDLSVLTNIASQLSNKVTELSSDKRRFIHLTGVFACNFVNHMYALSSSILEKAQLPFDVALPLIDETARKVHTLNPLDAQTGPAVRFDENVMDKHLEMIEDEKVKNIYRLLSDSIHQTSLNK